MWLIGYVAGWFCEWLLVGLAGWLVGCVAGWLACYMAAYNSGNVGGCLAMLLGGCLATQLAKRFYGYVAAGYVTGSID